MTYVPSEAESRMRRFVCGHCGAAVGDPCKTMTERPRTASHADRFYQARAAGLLPLVGQTWAP